MGGEVEPHLWLLFQKISNCLGLMRGEIVENDMDLLPRPALRHHLSEEMNEVGAAVADRMVKGT